MGHYTHANVIREVLSELEGDIISEGTATTLYQTQVAPDWNKDNLYLVAFIHRSKDNGGLHMQVLNSNEGTITDGTGIREMKNESVNNEKRNGALYDLSGRPFNSHLPKGVYITNGHKVLIK